MRTVDQIKVELWASFHKLVSETMVNNCADHIFANEQLTEANATLTIENTAARAALDKLEKEVAALKKAAEPTPVILTPPVPPAQ